jgi:hypothetical protein
MDYHIENITVWEAYEASCECPLCKIKEKMDTDYVDSYLGNAAMLPEIRVQVNKKGFCKEHLRQLYDAKNRLPLALQLHTYLLEKNKQDEKMLKELSKISANSASSLFKPRTVNEAIKKVLDKLQQDETSCIICEHIDQNMVRYIETLLDLYRTNLKFRKLFQENKGYCSPHFRLLLQQASCKMNKKEQSDFIPDLINNQLTAQQRLANEVEWFTKKFDYQNKDRPWGNSRDAIPRTINKLKGQTVKTDD